MDIFFKKNNNFTKKKNKKKKPDRTCQGPLVEIFFLASIIQECLREFLGRITGLRCYDKKIDFREGVCFCFVFFPFFCLPELFSFISPPFFPFLK